MNDNLISDHPQFDELIKELKDLKKFIEDDGGETPELLRNRTDFDTASTNNAQDEITENELFDPPPPVTPVLKTESATPHQAVAPARQQADLFNDSLPRVLSAASAEESIPVIESRKSDTSKVETPTAPVAQTQSGFTDNHQEAPSSETRIDFEDSNGVSPLSNRTDESEENLTEFVYDLADRIIQSLDNTLLSKTGEELPDDLRNEFRESVADILYEWT